MTTKNHDRKEGRSANTRLASCGVMYFNSSVVFQINFSAGLTVLCPEIPHERQAQNRYKQAKKTTVQPLGGHLNDQTFDFQTNFRTTFTRLTISLYLDTDLIQFADTQANARF